MVDYKDWMEIDDCWCFDTCKKIYICDEHINLLQETNNARV